jgi:hypothetical protein
MRKIIDSVLLEMSDRGDQQNIIARHFGVSGAAVSKRLNCLRQQAERSSVFDKLTPKEQRFVAEIAAGTSQTAAALAAINVSSISSAKTIGSRLANSPEIKEAIAVIMETEGLSCQHLIQKMKVHVDGVDPTTSLKAIDMGLKLHDAYPAKKSLNINDDFEFMPINPDDY